MSVEEILDSWERRGERLQVADANSRIWREGRGDAVVCLHGVPASGFLYRKVLPALADNGLQGITFDLPGLGFADRPDDFDYSWTNLSKWTADAVDAAGIKDFHLVVHDIGGPIGFDVVRRIPGRVLSLTILNTVLKVASFRRPLVMEPFAHRGIGWLWLQGLRTPAIVALMRLVGVCGTPTNEELRAYGALLVRGDNGRAFLKIMRAFERTNEFEARIVAALRDRNFPVQVVWGALDPALKMKVHAQDICRTLKLPAWHEVRGKHFLQEDCPDEIAGYISALVSKAH